MDLVILFGIKTFEPLNHSVRVQAPISNKCKNHFMKGRGMHVVDDKSEVNKEGSRVICNPVPTSFQAHRVTY